MSIFFLLFTTRRDSLLNRYNDVKTKVCKTLKRVLPLSTTLLETLSCPSFFAIL